MYFVILTKDIYAQIYVCANVYVCMCVCVCVCVYCCCLVAKSCPTLCKLMVPMLLCPWDFPGKNTEVGCHCLIQDQT